MSKFFNRRLMLRKNSPDLGRNMAVKVIAAVFFLTIMTATGCGTLDDAVTPEIEQYPVALNVTTTWAGNDGGTIVYQKFVNEYQENSGILINDSSGSSDETFKTRVLTDFEVGGEPDVLFYFTGTDANTFIKAGKVVSVDTIRESFPEYASNMNDEMFTKSLVDGEAYAVPAYGFWEGMFVNKKVCEESGVKIPDANTTWEEFLEICAVIKQKGYTPIAASLAQEPHYLFEFAIYNYGTPQTHGILPESVNDEQGEAWISGITEIQNLYNRGYLSPNTLTSSADEIVQSFIDGEAAFLIEGSWRIGGIMNYAANIEDFGVTFVPGNGGRKATDIIGGFSSGWYITTKCWQDEEKRKAAVEFITYMTQENVIAEFSQATVSTTALTGGVEYNREDFCTLQKEAAEMLRGATSIIPAVQDSVEPSCRVPLFDGMQGLITGETSIPAAVYKTIGLIQQSME